MDIKKTYKATTLAMLTLAACTLIWRIVTSLLSSALAESTVSEVNQDIILDVFFSVPVQILFCFAVPLLIYKLYLKKSTKDIFIQSNFKRTNWKVNGLSVIIGFCVLIPTTVISAIWLMILMGFGYNYNVPATYYPDTYNPLYLILMLVLTGVLPAFCEEFAVRGMFLSSQKNSYKLSSVLIVMALSFGLFHQNITQLLYTAVFGGFMAYLVLKTESLYPAMIIHFINNGARVIMADASHYGWDKGAIKKFYDVLESLGLISMFFAAAIFVGIIVLCVYGINKTVGKKIEQPKVLYKPSIRENVFLIGAIVLTGLSTLFTFVYHL